MRATRRSKCWRTVMDRPARREVKRYSTSPMSSSIHGPGALRGPITSPTRHGRGPSKVSRAGWNLFHQLVRAPFGWTSVTFIPGELDSTPSRVVVDGKSM